MTDSKKHSTKRPAPSSAGKNNGKISSWFSRKKKLVRTLQETATAEDLRELITDHERMLLSNILKLRDSTVLEVMIPRADIFAIDVSLTQSELFELLAEKQFSRIPVYKDTLDDVLGTIHIKDVMATLARGEEVRIGKLVKDAPIVSPAMNILDLLLKMRQSRRHMAFVVDEFGGIDGLVTINDVLEAIIGEIYDEHDRIEAPKITKREDGSALIDARLSIEEFEEHFGAILTPEEREESDTIGGLIFSIAGRVPARGEVITHETGMVFEVLEADPRRVNFLKVRNVPAPADTRLQS